MNSGSLSLVAILGFVCLLIERFFYYRSKYKIKKDDKWIPPVESDNPSHGERIAKLETGQEVMAENNEKDHGLIRKDIRKIFNLIDEMRK